MNVLFKVFCAVASVGGALALIAGAMWGAGWCAVQLFKAAKIWHVICLAISVRLHGAEYADRQFWWAIKERASKGDYHAKLIADYANSNAPHDGSTEL